MGLYTEHWNRYRQHNARATLRVLAVLVGGLGGIALLGFLLGPLTDVRMAILGGALVVWLVGFIGMAVRANGVVCPRCSTKYARGKYLTACPQCGLKMLQEDP